MAPTQDSAKSQEREIIERVTALVDGGLSHGDAVRAVATERDVPALVILFLAPGLVEMIGDKPHPPRLCVTCDRNPVERGRRYCDDCVTNGDFSS